MKKLLILLVLVLASCKEETPPPVISQKTEMPPALKPLKRTVQRAADSIPAPKEQTISNKLLYEVINSCLSYKRVAQYQCRYIRVNQNYELFSKGFENHILLNDSIFLKRDRIKDQKDIEWKWNFRFDEVYLPGYGVIDVDSLHERYKNEGFSKHMQQEYDGKYLTLFLPIFNKTQNYAMMAVGTTTFLPGAYDESVIYILSKSASGWKVVSEQLDWWRGKRK